MKGLLLKDLMCLRKQCVLFGYVVFVVLIMSIMLVLSVKVGNLAGLSASMEEESGLTVGQLENLLSFILMLFMLLPIVMTEDVTSIFAADGKAGFSKVSSSLPVSLEKRLLSRYLMLGTMFGIGVGVDTIITFILSLLTDIISFADFFGIIISVASIMLLYGAIAIVFCLELDDGKAEKAQMYTFNTMFIGFCIVKYKDIKGFLIQMFSGSGEEGDVSVFFDAINFMKYRSYVLLIIAFVAVCISYGLSLAIAKRKRGII